MTESELRTLPRKLAERLIVGSITCPTVDQAEAVILEAIEQTLPKWISVAERLPEDRGNVYVLTQHGASIGYRDFCEIPNWTLLYDPHAEKTESTLEACLLRRSVVTHWMPIPAIRSLKPAKPEEAE